MTFDWASTSRLQQQIRYKLATTDWPCTMRLVTHFLRENQHSRIFIHKKWVLHSKLELFSVGNICEPSDSRWWYFEEQVGEGKGRIKKMAPTMFSNWKEQKVNDAASVGWEQFTEQKEQARGKRGRNRKGLWVKAWAVLAGIKGIQREWWLTDSLQTGECY